MASVRIGQAKHLPQFCRYPPEPEACAACLASGLVVSFKKLLSGLEIDIILHNRLLVFFAHKTLGYLKLDGRS